MPSKTKSLNPIGRGTKLTPELQKKFCDWIRKGNKYKTACHLVGIHETTFHDWMVRGERGLSQAHIDFRDAVLAAEAEHEAAVVAQWEAINNKMLKGKAKTDWRSPQALLTYRHKWSPPPAQTHTHITQDVSVTVEHDLSQLSQIELAELSKLLAKTTPQLEDGSIVDAEFEVVESNNNVDYIRSR